MRSVSFWQSAAQRWSQSRRSQTSLPGRIGSGLPRSPWQPCRIYRYNRESPTSSRWRLPEQCFVTPIHRAFAGTRNFSDLLADRRDSLDSPPVHDETLHHVLRDAFDDARSKGRRDSLRLALRMLWVDDLLEAQRKVQVDLLKSADLFVRRRREARML